MPYLLVHPTTQHERTIFTSASASCKIAVRVWFMADGVSGHSLYKLVNTFFIIGNACTVVQAQKVKKGLIFA